MPKAKWIAALFLIILAAACGDKSAPTGPVADTPENRKAAAKRYLEAVPPQDLLKNMIGDSMQKLPEEARKKLQEAFSDKELLDHIYRINENALVKHFTPDEINALTNFFGSPAGKSARDKSQAYVNEVTPHINAALKKVIAKMQEPPAKAAEKEGAPKAAEQAKPASPEPVQPKAAKPEPAPPGPKKPEAKQPPAEQPKPEKPKN